MSQFIFRITRANCIKMPRTTARKVALAESPASNLLRPAHKRARRGQGEIVGNTPPRTDAPGTPPRMQHDYGITPHNAGSTPPYNIDDLSSSLARMDMPTPRASRLRHDGNARKKLTFSDQGSAMPQWSDEEVQFLVRYIILHRGELSWPSTHDPLFWDTAGHVIRDQTRSLHQRSGM